MNFRCGLINMKTVPIFSWIGPAVFQLPACFNSKIDCAHWATLTPDISVFLQPATWWTKASWPSSAPLAAHQQDPCSLWLMPCTSLTSSSSAPRQERRGAAAGSPGATATTTTRSPCGPLSTWMMSSSEWSPNMPGRNSSFFTIMTMVSIYLSGWFLSNP